MQRAKSRIWLNLSPCSRTTFFPKTTLSLSFQTPWPHLMFQQKFPFQHRSIKTTRDAERRSDKLKLIFLCETSKTTSKQKFSFLMIFYPTPEWALSAVQTREKDCRNLELKNILTLAHNYETDGSVLSLKGKSHYAAKSACFFCLRQDTREAMTSD